MIKSISLNRIATIASFSCLIHCIVTPIIILIAPFLGHVVENPMIELSLLAVSILCGVFIVHSGYCQHKKSHSLYLFGAGVCLWLLHTATEHLGIEGGKLFLVAGSLFVVGSYIINHKYLKCCEHC